MKRTILSRSFFDRPTLIVARELLGKYIVRRIPAAKGERAYELALMITEVEAYDGPDDLASHARFGRKTKTGQTPRNSILWGDAGSLYVYFNYGIHWLANVVTGPKEYPAAILFRVGSYRDPKTGKAIAVIGPARLTKFLKIDGALNRKRAVRASGLWFEDRGVRVSRSKIGASKRIGVDYAGPVWANKEYNFKIKPEI